MADSSPNKKVRQALMRLGGTFTLIMAGSGVTPEEVAATSNGMVTPDAMMKIMTGSDPDISVSKLDFVANQLGCSLVLGANVPKSVPATAETHEPVPAAA